ncbi:unnamed protein product, partial [Ixodes hexagonus]
RVQATYDKSSAGNYYGQGQVSSGYGQAQASTGAQAESVSSSYAAQPTAKSSFASAYRPAQQTAAKAAPPPPPPPQQQGQAGSNPAAAATYLYSGGGYASGTGYGTMQNSGGYHGQNSGGNQHQGGGGGGGKLPWGAGGGAGGGGGGGFKRAGPFVPKMMNKPKPPPKAPQLHYCEVCKISCAGPQTYKEHLEGQKHKKKEAALKSNGAAGAPPLPRGGTALRCELCDVTCTGSDAYAAHIRGAKHQKVVKLHTKLGKPIPSTEPVVIAPPSGTTTSKAGGGAATTTTTSAAVATGGGDTAMKAVADGDVSQTSEDGAGDAKDALDKGVEVQPVGQDYIEEMRNDEGKVISFQCKLCECRFNDPNAKEMHMKGRRHRLQFKKKVNPELVVDIKPSLRQRKLQEERLRRQLRDDFWKRREEDRWRDEMRRIRWVSSVSLPLPRMMEEEERMYWEERRRFEEEMEWCRWYGRGPGGMPMPPWPPMPGPPGPMGMPMPRRPDSVDDRHVMAKHSQIYPKEEDLGLVQRMVTNTEKALKMVSDALADGLEPKAEATPAAPAAAPATTPAATEDGKKAEEKKEEAQQTPTQQRLLKGVMRVGVLAKGLLLAGDLTVGLVVMCSEKPSRTLLARVAALLPKHLT